VHNQSYIVDDPPNSIFRVNRAAMTSPGILANEWDTIFSLNWLYIGHVSELAVPGEYRRRNVGGRPLFFVRGKDDVVRAFHNTCPHRGALICRQDEGVANIFQCFYHAWSFDTVGNLVGLPDEPGYGPNFDRGERALVQVARLGQYRGFYFVNFDREAQDLQTYLAGAKEYLDLVADQSLAGGMKIVKGVQSYSMRANWKLLVENSIDGYHGVPTHQTYFNYLQGVGGIALPGQDGLPRVHDRGAIALGNGHAVIDYRAPWGRPVARWAPTLGQSARGEIEEIREALIQKYGREWGLRIAETDRNLFIYPNLVINDIMAVTVRTFTPVRPDYMEVTAFELAPEEESGDRLARRLQNFLEFLGPGGFATPDDVEALESCQLGFGSGGVTWSDISRGIHRPARTNDELQMRAFWRQWNAQMTGNPVTRWDDGPVVPREPATAGSRP
jgi:p-cumate 2,3-dioxygenase subunit alpha